ncbi:MAG: GDSL family lipase [Alphaproteobacteria bacterium]|nr:MAG: GDSL family lipase [Caulobacteraceae bacterium]TPW08326.1 MAG: GDSL family lipase [Alphaproteobacteria bacterium]
MATALWLDPTGARAEQPRVAGPEPFAAEIAAFAKADENIDAPCAIMFVGSSSIRLWRNLTADMAPYPVINRGFGGATITDVNHHFGDLVSHRAPKAIFFYAGENDIAAGRTPSEVVSAFQLFLELKREALGATPVYFISLKPSPLRFDQLARQREVNVAIHTLARASGDLRYVDVAGAMMNHDAPRNFYVGDGLHMNDAGYAVWRRILRPHTAREARRRDTCGVRAP